MRRSDMRPKKSEAERTAERQVRDRVREVLCEPFSMREALHIAKSGQLPNRHAFKPQES